MIWLLMTVYHFMDLNSITSAGFKKNGLDKLDVTNYNDHRLDYANQF